jgi:hypothetical protein
LVIRRDNSHLMDGSVAEARAENRTALIWAMDTCFLIDLDECQAEAVELDRLDEAGWIDLVRMDVLDTELARTRDAARLAQRLVRSATFVEYYGPMVLDYSRLDHTVRAPRRWTARNARSGSTSSGWIACCRRRRGGRVDPSLPRMAARPRQQEGAAVDGGPDRGNSG